MTTEEIEKYLRTCGVQPTQTLVELCKEAYNKGYREGRNDSTDGSFPDGYGRYDQNPSTTQH